MPFKRLEPPFSGKRKSKRQACGYAKPIHVLQNGDWVGKGADTFYQEMNGSVLLTLKRLVSALEKAAARIQPTLPMLPGQRAQSARR